MRSNIAFRTLVFIVLGWVLSEPVFALTLDYFTTAEALAEVAWYDIFGLMFDADHDTDEATNARSYAIALYDKIQYVGEVGISALAEATVEPNEVILCTEITGSYEFDVGWALMEYFYQDANSAAEGWLQIDEFPLGAPCRLKVNISFPTTTWTGALFWQLYVESSLDYFLAGRDALGDYGMLSGAIDAYAGEPIYVFLGIAGGGYADHEIGDFLGEGTLTINATLTAEPHLADLSANGWVNFEDFALFSSHWHEQGCEDPNAEWCRQADLDRSGMVDANDLDLFTHYWLLFPDPNLVQ